jgi:sulfur carrier protein ThiS
MARAADEVRESGGPATIGVSVTLFADLRRYLPPGVDGPHRRTVPAGSTVAGLLAAIGVPEDADITVGVDGELADRATPLRDGADVMLLSPMEGGSPPRDEEMP